ncbi:hypothetical protein ICN84_12240 [Akkermansia glycaniphila]|uniref:cell division protein FtsZ n=1 Tax=Akkermansia glycaniphila TaxID=1679444 RepID=UPI001C024187|nr:cell division protein FtsZ [Akkermansia glycaniphila]MBT9450836.1 hypothetical protein [Akkermansia glycaniphila]
MLPYQSANLEENSRNIAIIGLGGAGANILSCFAGQTNAGIKLCTLSLDERIGRASAAGTFIQLGAASNHGFGSGGDPAIGAQAARESEAAIVDHLKGHDLLVLITGLGGGTGSGAAPIVARLARELGIFLVVVATMPFTFEGRRRRQQAETALRELEISANVLLCFENDHMSTLIAPNKGVHDAFSEADQLLAKATAAVPMLAASPGLINLGLDELTQALRGKNSRCIFGSGSARGSERATRAAERALESPLLAHNNALACAETAIVHIAGNETLTLEEIRTAMDAIQAKLRPGVNILFGAAVKPRLNDELRITILSSIEPERIPAPEPAPEQPAEPETPPAPIDEPEPMPELPAEPAPQAETMPAIAETPAEDATSTDAPPATEPAPEPEKEEKQPVESPTAEKQAAEPETPVQPEPEQNPVSAKKTEPAPAAKPAPVAAPAVKTPARAQQVQGSLLPADFKFPAAPAAAPEEEPLPEPEAPIDLPLSPELPFTDTPIVKQPELNLPNAAAYGLDEPNILDGEDLDIPPALRGKQWDDQFPG